MDLPEKNFLHHLEFKGLTDKGLIATKIKLSLQLSPFTSETNEMEFYRD